MLRGLVEDRSPFADPIRRRSNDDNNAVPNKYVFIFDAWTAKSFEKSWGPKDFPVINNCSPRSRPKNRQNGRLGVSEAAAESKRFSCGSPEMTRATAIALADVPNVRMAMHYSIY